MSLAAVCAVACGQASSVQQAEQSVPRVVVRLFLNKNVTPRETEALTSALSEIPGVLAVRVEPGPAAPASVPASLVPITIDVEYSGSHTLGAIRGVERSSTVVDRDTAPPSD